MNLYAYVANDPVNAVDPSGLDSCVLGPHMICANSERPPAPPSQDEIQRMQDELNRANGVGVVDQIWEQLCEQGDPVGCLAPNYRWNGQASGLAGISRNRLLEALKDKHSKFSATFGREGMRRLRYGTDMAAVERDWAIIRRELLSAHLSALSNDRNVLLSAHEIAQYHWDVLKLMIFLGQLSGALQRSGFLRIHKSPSRLYL